MYRVDTDAWVQQQVDRLPADALASYAELRTLLELKPWSGEPVNDRNPDGPVRTLTFGRGLGLVTYLILDDQRRVDVVQVLWLG
ncbi:MAG TPA: hypothetical protein VF892_16790 [Pseudonocardiaceae bacterium]